MKKLMLITVAILMSSAAMSAHGPAGCGLGSLLFAGKEGLIFNVVAATVNGSSGNQTFAMSTGTLGCEDAKTATVSAVSFIDNNLVALSNDISKGNGTTLNAYLALVSKSNANTSVLKENFSMIFSNNTNAQNINKTILSLI